MIGLNDADPGFAASGYGTRERAAVVAFLQAYFADPAHFANLKIPSERLTIHGLQGLTDTLAV